jgi:hypothetical protein
VNGHLLIDLRNRKRESPSAKTYRFHHPPTEARWEASLARPQWASLLIYLASEAGWMKRSKSSAKRLRFWSPNEVKDAAAKNLIHNI